LFESFFEVLDDDFFPLVNSGIFLRDALFESFFEVLDDGDFFPLVNSGIFLRDALFESFFEVLDDYVFVDFSNFITNGLLADGRRKLVVFIDFLLLDSILQSNTNSNVFNAEDNFLVCDLTGFVCDLGKDNKLIGDLT
jgi:hypothetical protein